MQDSGWDKIIDAIDVKFGIEGSGKSTETLPDNHELTQEIRFITFVRDGDTYKLERIARPAILDRRSIHHKAAGSGVRFQNIYDTENITFITNFYKKTGEEWVQIDPNDLAL